MTNDAAANPVPPGNPPGPHLSAGTLSAYVDGMLRPNQRAAADLHLQACAACRRDLADLRTTVDLLHALPEHRPQRSFQLSPEQTDRSTSWFSKLFAGFPTVQVAAVAVSVLLVIVIAGDLLTHEGNQGQVQMAVQAPSTVNSAMRSNAQESDNVQPQLGAKPASTNPPAAISAARQAEPTGAVESAAQRPPNAAAGAPPPAGGAAGNGAAESEGVTPPTASPAATPPLIVAPAPTVQPTEVANSQSTGTSHPSWWRITEIALAIILLWLIVSTIGLRRIRP
jgi:hypothetical protein